MPVLSLFPGGFSPDNSAGNAAAKMTYVVSSGAAPAGAPKSATFKLLFDQTTARYWLFQFMTPPDYVSGGTLRGKIEARVALQVGNVIMIGGQVSITDNSTNINAASFVAKDAAAAVDMNIALGLVKEFSIALTMTGALANRIIILFVGRDPADVGDTYGQEVGMPVLNFEYTN